MKPSNLAWRLDSWDTPSLEGSPPTEESAQGTPAFPGAASPPEPGRQRLARTRRLGMEYRAIVIRDPGLRLFRVR